MFGKKGRGQKHVWANVQTDEQIARYVDIEFSQSTGNSQLS